MLAKRKGVEIAVIANLEHPIGIQLIVERSWCAALNNSQGLLHVHRAISHQKDYPIEKGILIVTIGDVCPLMRFDVYTHTAHGGVSGLSPARASSVTRII
jgi:hypothetical protein